MTYQKKLICWRCKYFVAFSRKCVIEKQKEKIINNCCYEFLEGDPK